MSFDNFIDFSAFDLPKNETRGRKKKAADFSDILKIAGIGGQPLTGFANYGKTPDFATPIKRRRRSKEATLLGVRDYDGLYPNAIFGTQFFGNAVGFTESSLMSKKQRGRRAVDARRAKALTQSVGKEFGQFETEEKVIEIDDPDRVGKKKKVKRTFIKKDIMGNPIKSKNIEDTVFLGRSLRPEIKQFVKAKRTKRAIKRNVRKSIYGTAPSGLIQSTGQFNLDQQTGFRDSESNITASTKYNKYINPILDNQKNNNNTSPDVLAKYALEEDEEKRKKLLAKLPKSKQPTPKIGDISFGLTDAEKTEIQEQKDKTLPLDYWDKLTQKKKKEKEQLEKFDAEKKEILEQQEKEEKERQKQLDEINKRKERQERLKKSGISIGPVVNIENIPRDSVVSKIYQQPKTKSKKLPFNITPTASSGFESGKDIRDKPLMILSDEDTGERLGVYSEPYGKPERKSVNDILVNAKLTEERAELKKEKKKSKKDKSSMANISLVEGDDIKPRPEMFSMFDDESKDDQTKDDGSGGITVSPKSGDDDESGVMMQIPTESSEMPVESVVDTSVEEEAISDEEEKDDEKKIDKETESELDAIFKKKNDDKLDFTTDFSNYNFQVSPKIPEGFSELIFDKFGKPVSLEREAELINMKKRGKKPKVMKSDVIELEGESDSILTDDEFEKFGKLGALPDNAQSYYDYGKEKKQESSTSSLLNDAITTANQTSEPAILVVDEVNKAKPKDKDDEPISIFAEDVYGTDDETIPNRKLTSFEIDILGKKNKLPSDAQEIFDLNLVDKTDKKIKEIKTEKEKETETEVKGGFDFLISDEEKEKKNKEIRQKLRKLPKIPKKGIIDEEQFPIFAESKISELKEFGDDSPLEMYKDMAGYRDELIEKNIYTKKEIKKPKPSRERSTTFVEETIDPNAPLTKSGRTSRKKIYVTPNWDQQGNFVSFDAKRGRRNKLDFTNAVLKKLETLDKERADKSPEELKEIGRNRARFRLQLFPEQYENLVKKSNEELLEKKRNRESKINRYDEVDPNPQTIINNQKVTKTNFYDPELNAKLRIADFYESLGENEYYNSDEVVTAFEEEKSLREKESVKKQEEREKERLKKEVEGRKYPNLTLIARELEEMGIDPTSITDDDTFILSDGNAIIDGKFVLLDEDDPRRKEKQENKMSVKITPPKYNELSDEEKLPQSEIDFYDQIKSSGENLKKDYNYKSEINNINFNDNWDFSYTDKKSGITTFGSDEQINKNVNENENLIKENKEIYAKIKYLESYPSFDKEGKSKANFEIDSLNKDLESNKSKMIKNLESIKTKKRAETIISEFTDKYDNLPDAEKDKILAKYENASDLDMNKNRKFRNISKEVKRKIIEDEIEKRDKDSNQLLPLNNTNEYNLLGSLNDAITTANQTSEPAILVVDEVNKAKPKDNDNEKIIEEIDLDISRLDNFIGSNDYSKTADELRLSNYDQYYLTQSGAKNLKAKLEKEKEKLSKTETKEKDEGLLTPDPNLYYAVIDDGDGQRIDNANKSANYLKTLPKKDRDAMGMTIIKGDKINPDMFKNLAENLRDENEYLYNDIKNASKSKTETKENIMPLEGDVDGDGDVDFTDITKMAQESASGDFIAEGSKKDFALDQTGPAVSTDLTMGGNEFALQTDPTMKDGIKTIQDRRDGKSGVKSLDFYDKVTRKGKSKTAINDPSLDEEIKNAVKNNEISSTDISNDLTVINDPDNPKATKSRAKTALKQLDLEIKEAETQISKEESRSDTFIGPPAPSKVEEPPAEKISDTSMKVETESVEVPVSDEELERKKREKDF